MIGKTGAILFEKNTGEWFHVQKGQLTLCSETMTRLLASGNDFDAVQWSFAHEHCHSNPWTRTCETDEQFSVALHAAYIYNAPEIIVHPCLFPRETGRSILYNPEDAGIKLLDNVPE